MGPKGVCSYSKAHGEEFTWSEAVAKDPRSARCKLCNKTFSICSMGRTAFISHAAGKKHINLIRGTQHTPSAADVLRLATAAPTGPAASSNAQQDQQLHTDGDDAFGASAGSRAGEGMTADQPTSTVEEPPSSRPSQSLINKYLLNDAVTKAEIVWCLQAATKIHSNRAAADSSLLFPVMFTDSEIAKKMQLGRDKVGYSISYGLGPFFQKQLQNTFDGCDYVTIGFDEALNEVSMKKQMDLVIRYWDPSSDLVSTRYLTSVFLQSATAVDLRLGIQKAINARVERKLLQISMDGPAVNFKMLNDYQKELKEANGTSPLDLGSCGLHVVHGAFKTGAQVTSWELKEFLTALHYLFNKAPARRGHFTKITSSDIFPIPFCFTRWIENDKAGSRAISMLPHLTVWVEEVKREGKENSLNKGHRNFDRVAKALRDRLLGAKLAFFVSTAQVIEPFLTSFQSDNPMAPLLYRELESLTMALFDRVVQKQVLTEQTQVIRVKLVEANLVAAKDFDLGFSTKAAIKAANCKPPKIPDADILQFRNECKKFFVRMAEKIQERSPLVYKMTRAVSCLDPIVAAETPLLAESRLTLALEIVSSQKNWVSGAKADRIKRSYIALLRLPSTIARLKQFDGKQPRLDVLWRDVVTSAPSSVPEKCDLMDFIKMMLILYHSNAALERSFSLNKDCLIVNQKETSLIANRIVQDAVLAAGGVSELSISKAMVHAMRNSHAMYIEAKKAREDDEKQAAAAVAAKRKATVQLKELAEKREKIMEDARKEAAKLDERIYSLEKQ